METETKEQYIKRIAAYPRKDLLFMLRYARITAHALKTNEELAAILWCVRVKIAK